MVQLDITGLQDRARCMHFVKKIVTLQHDGVFGSVADRNWVLAALLPRKNLKILDIGSCSLVFASLLDREQTALYDYHTLDIEAIDNKPDWINEHLHDCNVPDYPVPDDYFDLIICSDVIEHIKEQTVLLEECRKKLKNDGVLYITTPNYSSLPSVRNLLLGKMLHDPCGNELEQYCFKEHVRYYTTAGIIPYLRTRGFHTSHCILAGLATVIPGKSLLVRFLISSLYNRLCLLAPRFSHQTILLLQKTECSPVIIRSPRIPVQK